MAILLPTDYVFSKDDGPVWVTSYASYLDVREKRQYILKEGGVEQMIRRKAADMPPIRFSSMHYFIEFAVKDNMQKINEQLYDIDILEKKILLPRI